MKLFNTTIKSFSLFSVLSFFKRALELGYGDIILVLFKLNGINSLFKTTAKVSFVVSTLYLERSSTKASKLTVGSRSIYQKKKLKLKISILYFIKNKMFKNLLIIKMNIKALDVPIISDIEFTA